MYYIGIALLFTYMVWFFIARKEQTPEAKIKILTPFYKMSFFLYKKIHIWNIPIFHSRQVRNDLKTLNPGENIDQMEMEFYIRKMSLILLVIILGTSLAVILKAQGEQERQLIGNHIVRQEYGERSKTLQIVAEVGKEIQKTFILDVPVRILSLEEAEELQEKFWEEVSNEILQSNISLNEIREELNLIEELETYPFWIRWSSNRLDLVSRTGKVSKVEEEEEVILMATVHYEEWEWEHSLSLILRPPCLTEEEKMLEQLERLIDNSNKNTSTEKEWELPITVGENEIIWNEKQKDHSLEILVLTLIAAIGIYVMSNNDLHKQLEKRKKESKEIYPLVVNKMVLYLGAGMTVRGAFQKVADSYLLQKGEGGDTKWAYEEMVYTCHELMTGMSEGAAYAGFGKRMDIPEYTKFASLLTQNIKKGNSSLLNRLREEATKSMQERMNQKKQVGEQTTTQLLIPMIMMLAMIMILIIIPAFSSFGI